MLQPLVNPFLNIDVRLQVLEKKMTYLARIYLLKCQECQDLDLFRQYVNPNIHKNSRFKIGVCALREGSVGAIIYVQTDDMEDINHHEYFTADSFLYWKRRFRLSLLRGHKGPLCEASTKPYDIRYPTSPCTWRIT